MPSWNHQSAWTRCIYPHCNWILSTRPELRFGISYDFAVGFRDQSALHTSSDSKCKYWLIFHNLLLQPYITDSVQRIAYLFPTKRFSSDITTVFHGNIPELFISENLRYTFKLSEEVKFISLANNCRAIFVVFNKYFAASNMASERSR